MSMIEQGAHLNEKKSVYVFSIQPSNVSEVLSDASLAYKIR